MKVKKSGYFFKRDKKTGWLKLEHRLVWEENFGIIPKEMFIHHKDGNKLNNNIKNLELLTRKQHSKRHLKPNRKRIKFPSGAVNVIKI